MEEIPHRHPDSAYSLDPAQWDYNQHKKRDRNIGILYAILAATAFIAIVASAGNIYAIVAFFLIGLMGLFHPSFQCYTRCTKCGQKLQKDKAHDRFLICPQCHRYIWTGNVGDDLS